MEAEDEQAFLHKLASEVASPKRGVPQKQTNEGTDGNSPLVSFSTIFSEPRRFRSVYLNDTAFLN